MVEKGPGMLSDEVRTELHIAACDLHLKRWDRMILSGDTLNGVIQTEWSTHAIGARSGVLFRAQVDCVDGTDYRVNFLLSIQGLKRGAEVIRQSEEGGGGTWGGGVGRLPVPELYDFPDLRDTGRTKH